MRAEIAARLVDAYEAAGYGSEAQFVRATGINDRQVRKYLHGEAMPGVRPLATMAELTGVSLDWLVTGRDELPGSYAWWLESTEGRQAPEDARTYLRNLPLRGYRPPLEFWRQAFRAYREGLHLQLIQLDGVRRRRSPAEFAGLVRSQLVTSTP